MSICFIICWQNHHFWDWSEMAVCVGGEKSETWWAALNYNPSVFSLSFLHFFFHNRIVTIQYFSSQYQYHCRALHIHTSSLFRFFWAHYLLIYKSTVYLVRKHFVAHVWLFMCICEANAPDWVCTRYFWYCINKCICIFFLASVCFQSTLVFWHT